MVIYLTAVTTFNSGIGENIQTCACMCMVKINVCIEGWGHINSWVALDVIIFLKSKTKEPPKLFSSSGMRGDKFLSVNNFPVQEHASPKKQGHFKFQSYKARNVFVVQNTYRTLISGFVAFLEVKVLRKDA